MDIAVTTTRIGKPKPSKGWAELSLHLGTPAGSGCIGTPYHSPSAEGHTIHTLVGRSPAPRSLECSNNYVPPAV